ncbi:hypothetical protein G5T42_08590 [Microbacterium sp. 4R-513]|uniref:hypothetical protein n=1 Tax=Microbacterium sp. 4R-513 TaxID=2567934 RepID=UPI0013E197F3|nr:hypothetical protein [Microbacterium sp. 4R-513]QIG39538.1 hypothetical protein G5T42_08590 [Microbacterium sp. 4R-513]
MPFRSQQTLEGWLDEFRALGHPITGSLKVMQQDGDDGADTGLVGVRFANTSTITYLQPDGPYSAHWVVTMEPREEPVVLDAEGVHALAAELAMVGTLCRFLEEKSADFPRADTP